MSKYYSKNGVLLINLETGFRKYQLSQSEKEVLRFEDLYLFTDTPEGFKNNNALNILLFQEYFLFETVEKKYNYLQEHLFEFHQAYKYYELHKQYFNFKKKGKNMNRGAYITYLYYRDLDKLGYTSYIKIAHKFTNSVENEIAAYIVTTNNQKVSFNKIFYERYLYSSVVNAYPNFMYNENEGVLINKETKEKRCVQFKTVTNTNTLYLEEFVANTILKSIKKNKYGLLVYASYGQIVIIDLNQEGLLNLFKKDKQPSIKSILESISKTALPVIEFNKFWNIKKR